MDVLLRRRYFCGDLPTAAHFCRLLETADWEENRKSAKKESERNLESSKRSELYNGKNLQMIRIIV
jgi:hypothetical protein